VSFDPDEVYHGLWSSLSMAYDWVMVPNVYGMSQFLDGGLMATNHYISGSNYLMKMSNYQKGGVGKKLGMDFFWRFNARASKEFFSLSNARLSCWFRMYDKCLRIKE